MSLLPDVCVICLSNDGGVSYHDFYECSCLGCRFHPECFSTYRTQYRHCPLCRKEEPFEEEKEYPIQVNEELPPPRPFFTGLKCIMIVTVILIIGTYLIIRFG